MALTDDERGVLRLALFIVALVVIEMVALLL